MKRVFFGLLVLVIVAIALITVNSSTLAPSTTAPLVSHTMNATPSTMSRLRATFLRFKLHNKEMVVTDRITWGRVIQPSGPNRPFVAYDAIDHREWALASFNLVLPASYQAEVSFQDGGNMGIFERTGGGPWVMTGSPGFPLCPKVVPSVVAHLWRLKNYPACG